MTNATAKLLQPQRAEGESFDAYKTRRQAGHDYVESSKQGTLFWNTNMSGAYFNDARKSRPNGKSGHRTAKKIARMARQKIAQGELNVA